MLIAFAAALAYLAATSNGLNDAQGRPLGTDFSNVYAAGTYVLEGQPQAPFDPATQYAREQAIFGAATPFYGWHYPPFFLFVAAALALLPYVPALLAWQGAIARALSSGDPGDTCLVMAGPVPAIHAFPHGVATKRGWPGQARP